MPYRTLLKYWMAITAIESEKYKLEAKISLVPHMKKQARDKFINTFDKLYNKAVDTSGSKVLSALDLAKKLAQRMSGNG